MGKHEVSRQDALHVSCSAVHRCNRYKLYYECNPYVEGCQYGLVGVAVRVTLSFPGGQTDDATLEVSRA